MHILLLVLITAIILQLPATWVQREMAAHDRERPDLPFTGTQIAYHLLLRKGLAQQVAIEETTLGNHYSPTDSAVRLQRRHMDRRSLTAMVVAAHEVGHAVQHARGDFWLRLRSELIPLVTIAHRVGWITFLCSPFIVAATRTPTSAVWIMVIIIGSRLLNTVLHIVTLPMEWNASFREALPALTADGYLNEQDAENAHRILRAAALTYVAQAVASTINVFRGSRIPRM